MQRFSASIRIVALLMIVGVVGIGIWESTRFSAFVDGTGAITLPDPAQVRAEWESLGTFAIQGEDGVEEIHNVYAKPGTINAFQTDGAFPDGAVLVKEVRAAASGQLSTGDVAWNGDAKLWFVMVKDRKNRFPENPLWAKEWGWALYLAEDPAINVARDFHVDCSACHLPAKETEWVYTQGYPVLRD